MNQKSNQSSKGKIDVDHIEESYETKMTPICESCWIFKKNKNFTQRKRKSSRGHASPKQNENNMSRYDEHKMFLARLQEFHESLPWDKIEQPVVVNQLTPDSSDVKNIFVNNVIRSKYNINLKAMSTVRECHGSASLKNEKASSQEEGRSSRFARKCKVNSCISADVIGDPGGDEEDDEDFLLGRNSLATQNHTRREDTKKNGELVDNGVATMVSKKTSNMKRDTEGANLSMIDKSLKMKGTKLLESFKSKKRRKLEALCDKDCENDINNDKCMIKKEANDETNEKLTNVIEIDGEGLGSEIATESNSEGSNLKSKISCPMCNKLFKSDEINNHAYTCQGPQTQTRCQQLKIASQNRDGNYNISLWQSACKGLGDKDEKLVTKKQKAPIVKVDLVSEAHDGNKDSSSTSKLSMQDIPKVTDTKCSNKSNCEKTTSKNSNSNSTKLFNGHKQSRLLSKLSGFRDLSNKSTQDLIENYAKTIHKINGKNPPAKQLRSFGDDDHDKQEMVKCGRCDTYVADDQLKAHTDICLEQSMLIE